MTGTHAQCTSTRPLVADKQTECGDAAGQQVPLSDKALKKAAAKAEKEAKKAEREEAARAAAAVMERVVTDPCEDEFGFLPTITSSWRTSRKWLRVGQLDESQVGSTVWIRGLLQDNRCKGSIGFIVVREQMFTVQGVLDAKSSCSKEMIKWTASLPLESVVDVFGTLIKPDQEVKSCTQQIELHVHKIHCITKAAQQLPFQLKDANRPEIPGEDKDENGEPLARVSQDTRLDNRILDLRTHAMQGVLRISHQVCSLFREYLSNEGFVEIHTPKLLGGSSEGGSNVFKFEYFGRPGCLAQSPQLYKQMAISSDLGRVFEIGPVFRAENSNTHRHLCEFTGLDFEMAFKESYEEVLEVIEDMFKYIFKGLNQRCTAEIAAVHRQYPNTPFKWQDKVLRLDFRDAVQMLRDHGMDRIPDDISEFDFDTEMEKTLGKLINAKYDTDFYYIINYPLKVRPFYTMPNPTEPSLSNSYDFFMRGEEIVSGAQRVHDPELLAARATSCGLDVNTIKDYIEAFTLGAFPHAGLGIGLERVVMLFLGKLLLLGGFHECLTIDVPVLLHDSKFMCRPQQHSQGVDVPS